MGAEMIKKDMDQFQAALLRLSTGVSQASSIWKDPKFSELFTEVSKLAGESKDVMIRGENLISAIQRFDSIASEQY